MHLIHLKLWGVCIDGQRYVCCSECNEPTSCIVQPIGTHDGKVMYFGWVCFRSELCFLNCADIYTWVVNKQFGPSSLFLNLFMLICSMMKFISLLLMGMCPCVVYVAMWSSLVCL